MWTAKLEDGAGMKDSERAGLERNNCESHGSRPIRRLRHGPRRPASRGTRPETSPARLPPQTNASSLSPPGESCDGGGHVRPHPAQRLQTTYRAAILCQVELETS